MTIQTRGWMYQDTVPDSTEATRLADIVSTRPSAVESIVRSSPRAIPGLLQEAYRRGDAIASVIEDALAAEVERTGGVGRAFDALFMAALALEGEHSVAVRLRMRALVAERDRRLQRRKSRVRSETCHSFDGKDRLLDLADRDPSAARLYVRFREHPHTAAQQLLDEAMLAPEKLQRHAVHLGTWMRDHDAAARFADEIQALQGPNAERVKRYVLRELYGVACAAAASLRASRTDGANDAHVCIERLVPVIARIVADPDVAWLLVGGASDVPGLPSMRSICELLLDRCFSLAVQVEVRLALTYGAVELLRQAAEDGGDCTDDIEVVAELLGAIARVQRSVGIEANVAAQLYRIADSLGSIVPGARAKAAASLCTLLGFTGSVQCGGEGLGDVVAGLFESVRPVHAVTADAAQWCEGAVAVLRSTLVA
jgi:hypothetical protein